MGRTGSAKKLFCQIIPARFFADESGSEDTASLMVVGLSRQRYQRHDNQTAMAEALPAGDVAVTRPSP